MHCSMCEFDYPPTSLVAYHPYPNDPSKTVQVCKPNRARLCIIRWATNATATQVQDMHKDMLGMVDLHA